MVFGVSSVFLSGLAVGVVITGVAIWMLLDYLYSDSVEKNVLIGYIVVWNGVLFGYLYIGPIVFPSWVSVVVSVIGLSGSVYLVYELGSSMVPSVRVSSDEGKEEN